MQLTQLLSPKAIRVVANVTSKKRLFQELGEFAHGVYGLPVAHTVTALMERENLGPTAVGHGIALPHARLNEADEVGSADRKPVDLVFALFAPATAGVEHLKALALVSRTLRDKDLCAKLRTNEDPGVLHAMLTEMTGRQAA